jgi:AraC-like DNA-binding protein
MFKLDHITYAMPIYMDIHLAPGVEAGGVAEAHHQDLMIQNAYQCECKTYWIDETRGVVFCLIEGPNKSAVEEMHRNSHGLMPHKIIDVKADVVESFLGRTQDPEEVEFSENGLKVFSDSAFRILLVTEMTDPVLLRHVLGPEKAGELLRRQNHIIRQELSIHGGREVEYAGTGFIASFSSAVKAISCALGIQKNLPEKDRKLTGFKMGINAGEPVSKSETLFGDTIQMARYLCTITHDDQIIMASVVKDLLAHDYFQTVQDNIITASPQDEMLLELLFSKLEESWQDPEFTVTRFCQRMSMSKSQLYRKTIALWNLSPNQLLKEFRLDKARNLLKGQANNIAQTTFDSGFTSPSYFTKCFKKKFGLLPAIYSNSLQ